MEKVRDRTEDAGNYLKINTLIIIYLFLDVYLSTISLPNGVNANDASFKCCLANGIPIIVIASKIAKSTCDDTPTEVQSRLNEV